MSIGIKRSDPEWHDMKQWLLAEIGREHEQLESPDEEANHNLTRGMIAAYRKIIRTVEPVEVLEPESPGYFVQSPNR